MNIKFLLQFCRYTLATLFLLIAACEDFQTKSYSMTDRDSKACMQLKDSVFQVISTASLSSYNPDWQNEQISQIAGEVIEALANDSIIVSENDQAYVLITGNDMDTTYVLLESQSASLTLYFDQALTQNLIAEDGVFLPASDSVIPLETIGSCTKVVKDVYIPVIKRRTAYALSGDRYLIQIIKTDQTEEMNIRLSVIAN